MLGAALGATDGCGWQDGRRLFQETAEQYEESEVGGEVGRINPVSSNIKKVQIARELQRFAFSLVAQSITQYHAIANKMLGKVWGKKCPVLCPCARAWRMVPPVKELSPIEVKRFTAPGLYAVGGVRGLHLRVAPGGSRSWILRVVVGSRRRDIGLGGFPTVTLQGARDLAREARDKIRQGIDPAEERRISKEALKSDQAKRISFKDAAIRCHAAKATEFRNEKHRLEWLRTLERYAFPRMGSMAVADIEMAHVLDVLQAIWQDKTETATRVRQRIEAVLTWATVSGYRTGENPARWVGNLKEVLPNPSKISAVSHHPALPWQGIGEFMAELRCREGMGARALEFAILTAARSGEVRGMTWDEVDLDAKVWTVPAGRIKAGRQHKVPLSADAVAVLKDVPRFVGSPFVFPAVRGGKLSDVALLAVVRRMGLEVVPHGFRSSFKDWARNCSAFPDEVSELALAHVNSDATRAAYARDELLSQRKKLMDAWARHCNTIAHKGAVTPIRKVVS